MANCHDILIEYDEAIKLSQSKKRDLRRSRDGLREKIREHISENQDMTPRFHGQGSFMSHTIITPLNEAYDVDDGVYFLVDEAPGRTPQTFHRWIVEAVEGYTDTEPIDKDACVRVLFKAGYHVDLPIYYRIGKAHPVLAHKRDGWTESDPKEFLDWLNDYIDSDGQLKRIIRYLKGWKDHLSGTIPSGLVLTILACNHIRHDDRDDVAMRDTLGVINNTLDRHFSCFRPTTPVGEDLLADCSESARDYFLERLDSFATSAEEAVNHPEARAACLKWRKHLGERVTCPTEESLENSRSFEEAAFIRSSARSA